MFKTEKYLGNNFISSKVICWKSIHKQDGSLYYYISNYSLKLKHNCSKKWKHEWKLSSKCCFSTLIVFPAQTKNQLFVCVTIYFWSYFPTASWWLLLLLTPFFSSVWRMIWNLGRCVCVCLSVCPSSQGDIRVLNLFDLPLFSRLITLLEKKII